MKNIWHLCFLCTLALSFNACLEDSGELADMANLTAATLTVNPGGTVIKGITNEISFPINFTDKSDPTLVQSIDVILNFEGLNNTVSDMKVSTITSYPADLKFTTDELLNQAGLTLEELNAGDVWRYSYTLNNQAGSTWQVLGDTRFTFTCESTLAGTYTAVTSGTSTDDCCTDPIVDFTSTVELTETRPGIYQISDFSAGLYFEWYDVYGVTAPADTPGSLEHVCDMINVVSTTGFFGSAVAGGGAFDEATGVITYTWSNGFGDMGTVTLTPQ